MSDGGSLDLEMCNSFRAVFDKMGRSMRVILEELDIHTER